MPAANPTAVPARPHTVTPYMAVSDARAAIAWYKEIFGAVDASEPIIMDDGRVGHAEFQIGDSVIMISDEWPEMNVIGPTAHGGSTTAFVISVPDVDTTFRGGDRGRSDGASVRSKTRSTGREPGGSSIRGATAGTSGRRSADRPARTFVERGCVEPRHALVRRRDLDHLLLGDDVVDVAKAVGRTLLGQLHHALPGPTLRLASTIWAVAVRRISS